MASISIIIPVLHEQKNINSCIQSLQSIKQKNDTIEIIVVDGSPLQDTNKEIIDSSVKKLCSKPGRGIQMHTGATQAQYNILLFVHADVLLPKNAYTHIQKTLKKPNIFAGAFSLRINTKSIPLQLIAKLTTFRSKLFKTPYGDQAIFLQKTIYYDTGGYRKIPIMEDLDLMRRIRKNHYNIHILKESVVASPRRWEKEGILASTLRNQFIKLLFFFGVNPNILVRFYQSDGTEKRVQNL